MHDGLWGGGARHSKAVCAFTHRITAPTRVEGTINILTTVVIYHKIMFLDFVSLYSGFSF
jgi:hypothetical protein